MDIHGRGAPQDRRKVELLACAPSGVPQPQRPYDTSTEQAATAGGYTISFLNRSYLLLSYLSLYILHCKLSAHKAGAPLALQDKHRVQ